MFGDLLPFCAFVPLDDTAGTAAFSKSSFCRVEKAFPTLGPAFNFRAFPRFSFARSVSPRSPRNRKRNPTSSLIDLGAAFSSSVKLDIV